MTDLVLLSFGDGEFVRCRSLNDAKAKTLARGSGAGRAWVEITPAGGGFITTLEFDYTTNDWISERQS